MTAPVAPSRFVTPRSRRWATLAEHLFLWLPGSARPGLAAFILCLVRETLFPTLIIVLAVIVASPMVRLTPDSLAGQMIGLGAFALFEELARYAFGRKARSPARAMILFTALTIVVETVTYYRSGETLAWNLEVRAGSWVVHLLAGLALWWGLSRRWAMAPLVAVMVVLHAGYNIANVRLDLGVHAAAAGPMRATAGARP